MALAVLGTEWSSNRQCCIRVALKNGSKMGRLLDHPWIFGLLLAGLLAFVLEAGYRAGAYFRIHKDADRKEQLDTIRDGLFVLISLILGFTLALAAPRFADRHSLLVEEAITIGTAYLRAGTLSEPQRSRSQDLFRKYVDARRDFNNAGLDAPRFIEASIRSKQIHDELWKDAAAAVQVDRSAIASAYIESLNETIDLHEKRVAAIENRVPASIWLLVVIVGVIAVFTRGLTLRSRFWLNLLVPVTIAIVAALIDDLDTPSSGLIRRDQRAMQRLEVDLRSGPH